MGATLSTPKVLVLGTPGAGRKTLMRALSKDAALDLVPSLEADDTADAVVYVLDATAPSDWAGESSKILATLHSVNKALGRLVPLLVCVNKRDVEGSAPARQVVENLRLSGDVCAAVGGRVWRVVDCSAVGDVADVRKALLKMVANGQKPMGILAPKFLRYGASGDAPQGACAPPP